MASLSEELAKLANPTPVFKDPEDDIDDDTAAKIVEKDYDDDDFYDDDDDNQFSQLRRQTAAILADSDNRYAGAKVTRKALKKISDNDDSDDEIDQSAIDALEKSLKGEDESMDDDDGDDDDGDSADDDDDDDDDDAIDDEDLQTFKSKLGTDKKEFSFEDDGDYSKYADDDDDDDESNDGESDVDDECKEKKKDDNEDSEIEEEDDNDDDEVTSITHGGIESFSRSNQSEEMQKGKAAQSQLGLWDNLLEERIKVQKVASVINQLPQPATWDLFMKQGGDNYKQAVTDAKSVLKKLLDSLHQVQTLLLHQNQETSGSKPKSDDDEEITSESETESAPVVEKPQRQQTDIQGLKRKFKMSDYPDFLAKRHTGFATYRNETLHKWNDKTQLATGKIKGKSFSALEQSALKQIEQIMRDKDRLIRRTQLKRSGQRILGVEEKVAEENQRHAQDNQEVGGRRDEDRVWRGRGDEWREGHRRGVNAGDVEGRGGRRGVVEGGERRKEGSGGRRGERWKEGRGGRREGRGGRRGVVEGGESRKEGRGGRTGAVEGGERWKEGRGGSRGEAKVGERWKDGRVGGRGAVEGRERWKEGSGGRTERWKEGSGGRTGELEGGEAPFLVR